MIVNSKKAKFKIKCYYMNNCKLDCQGYIPQRRSDDFSDLQNPFITSGKKNCESKKHTSIFKNKIMKKKDELFIILCFILFLLIAKLMYF